MGTCMLWQELGCSMKLLIEDVSKWAGMDKIKFDVAIEQFFYSTKSYSTKLKSAWNLEPLKINIFYWKYFFTENIILLKSFV